MRELLQEGGFNYGNNNNNKSIFLQIKTNYCD